MEIEVNASLAIRTSAGGWLEWPLLAAGSASAVITAAAFGAAEDIPGRAITAAVGVTLIIVSFALLPHLQLALYSFIPLMTVARVESAPVDFMTVGLLGALAIRGDIRRTKPPKSVVIALPMLVLSYAISLVASPSSESLIYAAATLLMIAIGCVAYELASKDQRITERAVVLSGLVLTGEAFLALTPIGDQLGMREAALRLRGLFIDANEFGSFALPAVLLLCARWPGLSLRIRVVGIGVLLLPVAASLSRAAALALGVALVVLAAIAAYRRLSRVFARTAGVLVVGAVGAVLLLAIQGAALPERDTSSLIQPYDNERFAGQIAGLNEFLAHPISVGIGPGNYETRTGHLSYQTYLRMLVETGPLTLVAFVLLLWSGIRVIRVPDLGAVGWAAALAGFAVCGLFVDTLHWRILWLVLGITIAFAGRERVSARGQRQPSDAARISGATSS